MTPGQPRATESAQGLVQRLVQASVAEPAPYVAMQVVQGVGPAVLIIAAVDDAAVAFDWRGARERDRLVRRRPRSMKGEEEVKGRLAACKQHNRYNAGSTKAMYRHRTPLKKSAQISTLRDDNKPARCEVLRNLFPSHGGSGRAGRHVARSWRPDRRSATAPEGETERSLKTESEGLHAFRTRSHRLRLHGENPCPRLHQCQSRF